MAKKKEINITIDPIEDKISIEPIVEPSEELIIESAVADKVSEPDFKIFPEYIQKSDTEFYVTASLNQGEDVLLTNSNDKSRKVTIGQTGIKRIVINPHEAAHIRLRVNFESSDSYIVRFELFERLKESFYLVQNELTINDTLMIENISDIPKVISDEEIIAILKFIKV